MKNLNPTFKTVFFATLVFFALSCDNENQNDNPNENQNETLELLSISASSTDNACNEWNLLSGNTVGTIASFPSFINLRSLDPITSPAGLLAQTTMTHQCSAYDNINKKYAVALGETVVIYDLTSPAVPVPTSYLIAPPGSSTSSYILAMEYVGGQLYVVHGGEIKTLIAGVPTSFGVPVVLPSIGIMSDTISNFTKNGTTIYFILKGKLFTFDTLTNSLTNVPVSGWSSGIDYNGVEFYSGKLYAAKRHSLTWGTPDDFATITLTGSESLIPITTYAVDFSRISSAVDPNTGIYYLSSSDGFGVNTNTLTEINLISNTHNTSTIAGYQFGLQIKN
ncbi:hypothetical protein [Flavobacterium sp.]|uniref:hypothetical protein n=1 Tax=Flavobacterium sp. TaxID=239 RepID=UPI003F6A04C6